MITRIGICSLLAGIFVFIFSGISNFMGADNLWVDLNIAKLLGEEKTEDIITGFESAAIQNMLDLFCYEIPFFGILMLLGGFFLMISLFVKDH